MGTYLHGVFDAAGFRRGFINRIRKKKMLGDYFPGPKATEKDDPFDRMADLLRNNIDTDFLKGLLKDKKMSTV